MPLSTARRKCLALVADISLAGPCASCANWMLSSAGGVGRIQSSSRHGVGLDGDPAMVPADRRRMALYRAGQAYIERLRGKLQTGRFRDECLNDKLFSTLSEGRYPRHGAISSWKEDYNQHGLHSATFGRARNEINTEKNRLNEAKNETQNLPSWRRLSYSRGQEWWSEQESKGTIKRCRQGQQFRRGFARQ